MKKTPVIILDLKFLRVVFLILLFILFAFASSVLCKSFSAPPLPKPFVKAALRICPAFSENEKRSAVFSFVKAEKEPREKIQTPPPEKETTKISAETENIKALSPQKIANAEEIKINNSTEHRLDTSLYLKERPQFLREDFSVLIVHTHTTESYTPSEKYSYTPTDTDRTRDKRYNTVRVGDEIEKILKENGIKVYHDTTVNDYPGYNGSYNRSALNVSNSIKNDPSIKMVLDVHRDAIEGKNGEKIKYTSKIDGEDAACVMLVVGSNLSGLEHNNWEENLSFAAQLQQYTQRIYPTLLRPINFRSQRFNQQLAPGAVIVEVGTNGNSLDEALRGAACFAKALSLFIKEK